MSGGLLHIQCHSRENIKNASILTVVYQFEGTPLFVWLPQFRLFLDLVPQLMVMKMIKKKWEIGKYY